MENYVFAIRTAFLALMVNTGLFESLAEIPALISFGDSTVDVGNNNHLLTMTKSNHPPYGRDFPGKRSTGRFCNGLLVTDYFASMLGLPSPTVGYLNPEAHGERILTGVTFASAGSGILDATAKHSNVLTLGDQLLLYKQYREDLCSLVGEANASRILSEAVHIISTGSNDYVHFFDFNIFSRHECNRIQFRNHLLIAFSSFIQELQGLGASKIGVVSLPPLGCVPFQVTLHSLGKGICAEYQNKEAAIFNVKLRKKLRKMNGTGGGMVAYLDAYKLMLSVLKNPAKYGFAEGRRGCCGTGLLEASIFCNEFSIGTCKNASKYVFWDSFHPTDRTNMLVAKFLLRQAVEQSIV